MNGQGQLRVTGPLPRQWSLRQLPEQLRRSITWDQGKEMAQHARFSVATGVPVYFCDRRSPWQRGSNENTNGLLRQYFPKRSDLKIHTQADLDAVADELNERHRCVGNVQRTRCPRVVAHQQLEKVFPIGHRIEEVGRQYLRLTAGGEGGR